MSVNQFGAGFGIVGQVNAAWPTVTQHRVGKCRTVQLGKQEGGADMVIAHGGAPRFAVSDTPKRRRLGLYFDILDHNVKTDDFAAFVVHVLRRLGRPITLVMDRYTVHRSAAKQLQRRFGRRIQIEWLPACAPELNPDEQVWNRAKDTDLANFIPEDVNELDHALADSLRRTPGQQPLLRSFFQYARLSR